MTKQIGILTATRAEFGLLKPLIIRLMKEDFCDVKVLVTGMHLSEEFGNTYREIEEAGIPIAKRIECISDGDTPKTVSKNMGIALTGFGEYFEETPLDLLIVLGDRYETLAVCIAAMNARIPIAHIAGGEATEGLIDEAVRHSITKMSRLHFATTDVYKNRIIQMGEQPEWVYNVGALAVENALTMELMTSDELGKDLGVDLRREYAVVTYHPVTLEEDSGVSLFDQLLEALDQFPNLFYIFTKANADAGGRYINQRIDEYVETRDNSIAVVSLGVRRYLSAVKGSCAVIGNSSSGITEAPCFHIPTVNIGDRQKGRIMPESVICCESRKDDIVDAISKALSKPFVKTISSMTNPFGEGKTSELITGIIRDLFETSGSIGVKKHFYDIEVTY